ncbi:MAG: hypothetical protein U0Y68_23665 [Blastocatellia bacterium]
MPMRFAGHSVRPLGVGLTGIRLPVAGNSGNESAATSLAQPRRRPCAWQWTSLWITTKKSAAEIGQQLGQWGVTQPFGDEWLRLNGVGELDIG